VERAGIGPGDVILAVGKVEVEDRAHYLRILRNFTLGQDVRLDVAGQRGRRTVAVTLQSFTDKKATDLAEDRWGIRVQALGRELAVSAVKAGSPAARLGLRQGDVLVKIAGDPQASVTDFARAFKRYRMANTVMLLVERDGRGYHVRLRI
jgi:S1-C subfamily serine protease